MDIMRCIEYKTKYCKDSYTAILHSYTSQLAKFLVVRESATDGVEFVSRRCIKKIVTDSKYTIFINECIKNGLMEVPKTTSLNVDDRLKNIIASQQEIIGIDVIYEGTSVFLVGRVKSHREKGFEIECVDVGGAFDGDTYYHKYSEVIRVATGGSYLNMLNKWISLSALQNLQQEEN